MDTHELAEWLLQRPKSAIKGSVDISTGDDDIGARAFGELYSFQHDPAGTVTLLFDNGLLNNTQTKAR